jgi:hypothetical protein
MCVAFLKSPEWIKRRRWRVGFLTFLVFFSYTAEQMLARDRIFGVIAS